MNAFYDWKFLYLGTGRHRWTPSMTIFYNSNTFSVSGQGRFALVYISRKCKLNSNSIVVLRIPCRERPASSPPTNAPASIYLSTPLHPLTNSFSPARSPTLLLSSPACLSLLPARLHARLPCFFSAPRSNSLNKSLHKSRPGGPPFTPHRKREPGD